MKSLEKQQNFLDFFSKLWYNNISKKERGESLMGKISPEIIKQIPILFSQIGNKSEVARQLGISVGSVNKYLSLYEAGALNQPINKEKEKRKEPVKITPELIEKINKEYEECLNKAEVARRLGISSGTVHKYLTDVNKKKGQYQWDDRDALFFYIFRLFGQNSEDEPVSNWNLIQMEKFKKQGISYRAQLLTLKYFYEVKRHTTEKSNNSIGIISYVVSEAQLYYETQAAREKEILEAIQKQLEKDRVEIKYNPSDYIGKRKKKKLIDLNTIGSEDGAN